MFRMHDSALSSHRLTINGDMAGCHISLGIGSVVDLVNPILSFNDVDRAKATCGSI